MDPLELLDSMLKPRTPVSPVRRRTLVQREIDELLRTEIEPLRRGLATGNYSLVGRYPATRQDLEEALAEYERRLDVLIQRRDEGKAES